MFGAVKPTKDSDIDKYKYSGYGIGFDAKATFSHPSGGIGQNRIIFGADMTYYVNVNNKTNHILILGEGITQGVDDTTLTAEKMYSINFTVTSRKFCLILHYNGANSYLCANGTEITKFKAKDSELQANPICLGNISEDFSVANIKKTWIILICL